MAGTKSKKQAKNKKSKKNAAPRRKAPAVPVSRVVSKIGKPNPGPRRNHVTTICSVTDPFCVHARGSQRPDGGPPTIPFQIRAVATILAATTSGAARWTFGPNVGFPILKSTFANPTYTNDAAWVTAGGDAFVTANAKEVRLTSFGVIVRSAMTATAAKGLVILNVDPAPVPSGTAVTGAMQGSESQIITLAAGMEHTWVSKPLGPSAHLFRPLTAYTSTATDMEWTSLAVEVTGSDTTNVIPFLTVEIVMNVEFTVVTGGATGGVGLLQKTPPVPNRVALAAQEHVHATTTSFIAGGISEATSFLEKTAKGALDTILSDGMALLFG